MSSGITHHPLPSGPMKLRCLDWMGWSSGLRREGMSQLDHTKSETKTAWEVNKGQGFPGGSDGKECACNVEDLGWTPGLGRSPGEGKCYPLQYSCLENPHGQRSLAGYSPWGRRVGYDWATKHSTASGMSWRAVWQEKMNKGMGKMRHGRRKSQCGGTLSKSQLWEMEASFYHKSEKMTILKRKRRRLEGLYISFLPS